MKRTVHVRDCHICGKLLRKPPVFVVEVAGFDDIAYCAPCVKRGYLDLIAKPAESQEIEVIKEDFRRFLKKNKISIES